MTLEIRLEIMRRVRRIVASERKRMIYDTHETREAVRLAKANLADFLKEL